MQHPVRYAIIWAALLGAMASAFAAGDKPSVNIDSRGVALKGYDVTAYVTAGAAVKGDLQFTHRWNGAIWHFASAAGRDAFIARPEKYAPQFGGYCSWAVSRGYTADVDAEAWRIVEGRLYLNYSKAVQRRWEQDIPGNIRMAEANWPAVLGK